VRSLPGQFETNAATAGAFSNTWIYDLGLDYYRKLPAQLNAVTPAAMLTAARKYLDPQTLHVIIVGDRAKIEPELEKLNLGTIEHRDAEARVTGK
jgi:zinc protease